MCYMYYFVIINGSGDPFPEYTGDTPFHFSYAIMFINCGVIDLDNNLFASACNESLTNSPLACAITYRLLASANLHTYPFLFLSEWSGLNRHFHLPITRS